MGIQLPFGFPLDYPETGGMYEQMAHSENARFAAAKPEPNSPEWAAHRIQMAKLNALDAWAVNIGHIRRRRNFVLLLAIFFGRQLRGFKPWQDIADFRELATAANWREPAPDRFDREGFRKALQEADRVRAMQTQWESERQENQNEIDNMIRQIMHTQRGERWLAR